MYAEEGQGVFTTRMNVLGHMQQGGYPSPFDRNMATKMGAKSYNWLISQILEHIKDGKVDARNKESACLLGMRTRHYEVIEDGTAFVKELIFATADTFFASCPLVVVLVISDT